MLGALGINNLDRAPALRLSDVEILGEDVLLVYRRKP